eukprot:124194_1
MRIARTIERMARTCQDIERDAAHARFVKGMDQMETYTNQHRQSAMNLKDYPNDENNVAQLTNETELTHLQEHIHNGAAAEQIARKLIKHFTDEGFTWDKIVDDLRCDIIGECEAMTQII